MSPEDRAKSVLHFLGEYLDARDRLLRNAHITANDMARLETAKSFLGTALVALVTDVRKADE